MTNKNNPPKKVMRPFIRRKKSPLVTPQGPSYWDRLYVQALEFVKENDAGYLLSADEESPENTLRQLGVLSSKDIPNILNPPKEEY